MLGTTGEIRMDFISKILLWTPAHICTSVDWSAMSYIHQLSTDTGCELEDLLKVKDDWDGWWERVWELWCYQHDDDKIRIFVLCFPQSCGPVYRFWIYIDFFHLVCLASNYILKIRIWYNSDINSCILGSERRYRSLSSLKPFFFRNASFWFLGIFSWVHVSFLHFYFHSACFFLSMNYRNYML